jgi:hypothetical protein
VKKAPLSTASRPNTLRQAGHAWPLGSQGRRTTALNAQSAWGTGRVPSRLLLCLSLGIMACFAEAPAANADSNHGKNAASWAADDAVVSRHFTISVALAPGQPARYSVSGELFATEDELVGGTTVQVLVPGATYTLDYWDFGTVDGRTYSYARDVAAHGFPTFAFDEIGSGNSSHPPSNQVTLQSAAFVAHQVLQALRNGSIAGVPFGKMILAGCVAKGERQDIDPTVFYTCKGKLYVCSTEAKKGVPRQPGRQHCES